jgi:hypothetical protein
MTSRRLLALMLLAAALPAAAQNAYRWVDKDGRVQYSDQPRPRPSRSSRSARSSPTGQRPAALRHPQGRRDFPVTLYTGRECGKPCDDGRALLTKRGVPFSETKLETTDDVAAFKARFGKDPSPPPSPSARRNGLRPPAWNGLLNNAGYPAAKR